MAFALLHLLLNLLQSIPSNFMNSQSNMGALGTQSQVQMAVPETWVQGGTPGISGTPGTLPACIPSSKTCLFGPKPKVGQTSAASSAAAAPENSKTS